MQFFQPGSAFAGYGALVERFVLERVVDAAVLRLVFDAEEAAEAVLERALLGAGALDFAALDRWVLELLGLEAAEEDSAVVSEA